MKITRLLPFVAALFMSAPAFAAPRVEVVGPRVGVGFHAPYVREGFRPGFRVGWGAPVVVGAPAPVYAGPGYYGAYVGPRVGVARFGWGYRGYGYRGYGYRGFRGGFGYGGGFRGFRR